MIKFQSLTVKLFKPETVKPIKAQTEPFKPLSHGFTFQEPLPIVRCVLN